MRWGERRTHGLLGGGWSNLNGSVGGWGTTFIKGRQDPGGGFRREKGELQCYRKAVEGTGVRKGGEEKDGDLTFTLR